MTAVTDEARTAVLDQLAMAYERLAVDEQLTRSSDPELAEDYHRLGVAVLRARLAEDEDPKPIVPVVHCLNCAAAYAAGGK